MKKDLDDFIEIAKNNNIINILMWFIDGARVRGCKRKILTNSIVFYYNFNKKILKNIFRVFLNKDNILVKINIERLESFFILSQKIQTLNIQHIKSTEKEIEIIFKTIKDICLFWDIIFEKGD